VHGQVYTQATFREALRHYPVVQRLNKLVVQDRTIPYHRFVPNTDPPMMEANEPPKIERCDAYIPKGSQVLMDITALHMNREFSWFASSLRSIEAIRV
jgi:hypothetical protein